MESKVIRRKFIEFFKAKGHEIVDSAPMVIKDDPTLMFTNAGMNQFKDVFLGNTSPKFPRVANSQKCLRVSGKHNDLEEVGVDTYHHTMFEMLGNWSFGDYFKQEAIEWAWELLTQVYKIPASDLYITVFGGDEADGLEADEEAHEIWSKIISESRILKCDKKDNFWEMGDTGPCGPCSEIHVDLRSKEEKEKQPGSELVNKDHPQVIEIWNLVFMELTRMADGSLKALPSKHIDTGMGFERLAVVLQNKSSNYDTDVFQPLIRSIEVKSGKKYSGSDSKEDIAMRVISDHVRAVAFAITDGQLPSNNGAGYVIRRILRRAIRYAYSFLDIKESFIYGLCQILVDQLSEFFPEIKAQHELISKVIKEEEENFLRTLENGIQRLSELMENTDSKALAGKEVFELYDTYGFPSDLTALIAAEKGFSISEDEFEKELNAQKERSRAAGKIEAGDWQILIDDPRSEFIGYDQDEATVKITRFRKVTHKGKERFQIVFNFTPFYPEGGGQVGDQGFMEHAGEKVKILDTKKENNLIIHFTEELPGNLEADFHVSIDRSRRKVTANNHSATHLLHQALREVLGDHVEQKGSLVAPDYLRFDFSHFAKVSSEELDAIENRVNELIRKNIPLEESRNVPLNEAREMGAIMLFGEKYGDTVRVIEFGESKELCGGTHVPATGSIGSFRIQSESAVAAGIRRIEAISSEAADRHVSEQLELLSDLKALLKNPKDPKKAVNDLLESNTRLQKELESIQREKAAEAGKSLMDELEDIEGVKFIARKLELDPKGLKDLCFQMKSKEPQLFAVFGLENNGKAMIACAVGEGAVKEKGLHAGKVVKGLSKFIQGGGGGQPSFATAGGSNINGIENALQAAKDLL